MYNTLYILSGSMDGRMDDVASQVYTKASSPWIDYLSVYVDFNEVRGCYFSVMETIRVYEEVIFFSWYP